MGAGRLSRSTLPLKTGRRRIISKEVGCLCSTQVQAKQRFSIIAIIRLAFILETKKGIDKIRYITFSPQLTGKVERLLLNRPRIFINDSHSKYLLLSLASGVSAAKARQKCKALADEPVGRRITSANAIVNNGWRLYLQTLSPEKRAELPTTFQFRFQRRLWQTLTRLSPEEGQPPQEVINQLLQHDEETGRRYYTEESGPLRNAGAVMWHYQVIQNILEGRKNDAPAPIYRPAEKLEN